MTPEELCATLQERFAGAVERVDLEGRHPHAVIRAERWREVARFLCDDPDLRINFLRSITGLDLLAENKLAAVYDLMDVRSDPGGGLWKSKHQFAIRIEVDRDNPHIPSVADIWPAADWHEREAFDLFGIIFDGHPDLRRILCPEDWEGFPLRKDYEFPLEYHGIPATTEFGLPNPKH